MRQNQNAAMFIGDENIISFSVLDVDGQAVDMTSGSARWVLSRAPGSTIILDYETGGADPITLTEVGDVWYVKITLPDTATATLFPRVYYQECDTTDMAGATLKIASGYITLHTSTS